MGRVKVGWHVPTDEWDSFTDYVVDRHGQIAGYAGDEVELAMREWVDADDYASVEDLVDRLVEAAGRTPANLSQKKSATTTPPTDGDTTKIQTRVDAELKDNFAAHAKRDADERPGVVLARALRARRHGGRTRRLRDKLERVGDDAEVLLAEVAGEDGASLQEKRTVAIWHRLGNQFTRDDLEAAIEAVAGGSEPTILEYTDRVFDRLDYVEHPNADDLFIPEAEARDYGTNPDASGIDRFHDGGLAYDGLSRDDRVRGLRIIVARPATSNGGRAAIDAATVEHDVFDGHPSPGYASKCVYLAADADGFDVDTRRGKKRLRVDLRNVTDDAVLDAVDGGDSGWSTPFSDTEPPASMDEDDGNGSDVDAVDDPHDIDDRMNRLMNATAVADGGVPDE